MDANTTKFIFFINSSARDGALGRQWDELEPNFSDQLPNTEFLMPKDAAECRQWVAEAAQQDDVCLVAVGGEGTMNTVANGIIDAGRELQVPMALVPFGNINDYAMAIGLQRTWQHALEILKTGNELKVGVTELVTHDRSSYALNLATIGFTASTAEQHSVRRQLPWLKGQLKYNILALKMLLQWKNVPLPAGISAGNHHARATVRLLHRRRLWRAISGTRIHAPGRPGGFFRAGIFNGNSVGLPRRRTGPSAAEPQPKISHGLTQI